MRTWRIAGAGIGGLAAAITLARAGEAVEVFERRAAVGSVAGPHTEGLRNYGPTEARQELAGFGLDIRPFARVEATVRRSPNRQNVLRGPAYDLVERGPDSVSLDGMMFGTAKRAGVRFRFETVADSNRVDVVATGAPEGRASLLGVGFTFSREGSRLPEATLYALLDNDVAPGGYLAVAPGTAAHSLHVVSWRDLDPGSLRRRMKRATEIPWVREILGSSERTGDFSGTSYFVEDPIATAVDEAGRLFVGEAGGFQDAIAGFGIRYAVITGVLAARTLLGQGDYRTLLRETFGSEFREAFAVRRKLNHATNDEYDRLLDEMGPEMDFAEYRDFRGARLL